MVKYPAGILALICLCGGFLAAQELPEDELQVTMNGYFDNFRVNIVYPSLSLSKQVGASTALNGRYLVDVISAASMKSAFQVDGISSATSKKTGGGDDTPDELRHEFGAGITQLLGDGSVSLNTLYSTEHDYTSLTLAASLSYPFAKKNTILQLGAVRSFDQVAPQTRSWERDKDVTTLSGGLTQVLSRDLLAQIDVWHSENEGLLSDAYQVVRIVDGNTLLSFEPVSPSTRSRDAAGLRLKYKVSTGASLQIGYRYYWDDWDINSHTLHGQLLQYILDGKATFGIGLRSYWQTAAYFFKPVYSEAEEFMAVDSKLNEAYSGELELQASFEGELFKDAGFLHGLLYENSADLNVKLKFYLRHTVSADWHSRLETLYAYILSIGYRYRF